MEITFHFAFTPTIQAGASSAPKVSLKPLQEMIRFLLPKFQTEENEIYCFMSYNLVIRYTVYPTILSYRIQGGIHYSSASYFPHNIHVKRAGLRKRDWPKVNHLTTFGWLDKLIMSPIITSPRSHVTSLGGHGNRSSRVSWESFRRYWTNKIRALNGRLQLKKLVRGQTIWRKRLGIL